MEVEGEKKVKENGKREEIVKKKETKPIKGEMWR